MQFSFVAAAVLTAVLSSASVRAEQHIIRFENKCGKGTPQLIQGGKLLSTGEEYVHNGPFSAGIAYLQTGECLFNGEGCTLLEMTLVNPTAPGAGSSTDISLITPHAFNVEASFSYFGGCTGQGTICSSANCKTAFFQPNDNQVQVQCQSTDVNLLITFCGDATTSAALSNGSKPVSSSVLSHSSAAATHSSHSSVVSHAASSTHVATTSAAPSAPTSAIVNAVSTASSATPAASSGLCRAGSRRRRRSAEAEQTKRSSTVHRRHHARNAEAAKRGASI